MYRVPNSAGAAVGSIPSFPTFTPNVFHFSDIIGIFQALRKRTFGGMCHAQLLLLQHIYFRKINSECADYTSNPHIWRVLSCVRTWWWGMHVVE